MGVCHHIDTVTCENCNPFRGAFRLGDVVPYRSEKEAGQIWQECVRLMRDDRQSRQHCLPRPYKLPCWRPVLDFSDSCN